MSVNAQIIAYYVLFLLSIPAKHSQTSPGNLSLLMFLTLSARQGPCPGHVFSYSNRSKNTFPVLAIPGSFYGIPWFPPPPTVLMCCQMVD